MDINKYIKNKDIELKEEDFDIDKLTKDLRKGYVASSEVDEKVTSALDDYKKTSKAEYDKLKGDYDTLQNSYTDIEKRNTDLTDKIKTVTLERTMVEQGFNKDQFDEVSKMRNSLFGDVKDDSEAIASIKEKFKDTYFPTTPQEPPKQKDDGPINNGVSKPTEPKVNRLTSIKDLIKK